MFGISEKARKAAKEEIHRYFIAGDTTTPQPKTCYKCGHLIGDQGYKEVKVTDYSKHIWGGNPERFRFYAKDCVPRYDGMVIYPDGHIAYYVDVSEHVKWVQENGEDIPSGT